MGEARVIVPKEVNPFKIPYQTQLFWVRKSEISQLPPETKKEEVKT